jgi:hypothetical protein
MTVYTFTHTHTIMTPSKNTRHPIGSHHWANVNQSPTPFLYFFWKVGEHKYGTPPCAGGCVGLALFVLDLVFDSL